MMRHALLTLAIAALVLPAGALGKGPSGATIDGPGSGGGITFSGGGEDGGTPLGDLTQQAGFFPAAFGQEPRPMLPSRPRGDLGPKYTITYTVPDQSGERRKIRQDVYPYADPAPVTYLEPGQPIFDLKTRGGWFQADAALKRTLVDGGLPASAPASAAESGSSKFPTAFLTLLAAFVLVATATALLIRRRTRPAAA